MRIASDVGGTFTDLVVEDDNGSITMYKAATVPGDPVQGVLDALERAATDRRLTLSAMLGMAEMFIHGTTHAINAIITGNVARTALFVTQGHRDMLVFREGGRVEPFNHRVSFPKPYIPRALTFEVPERVLHSGEIHRPLDEEAVVEALAGLATQEVQAIAVCLLWATINPVHELRIGELIERYLPGVPYTLAHQVNPTLREFRRASSAAIDASLKPLMGRYLGSLTQRMRAAGFLGDIMVLTSGGGMVAASDVAGAPIKVINSGPSMAPIAGRHYAGLEGEADNIIVADTGGTTYDISLVRSGTIPMTRDLWIGQPLLGHLVGYPSVEVKSVGAGGGSIAQVDSGGLLRVGPKSAGAMPGPACYGRGGVLPTVTDAAVALGYIDPDFFLGGTIRLDRQASLDAIQKHVAEPLGLEPDDAAWRVMELATENMVQAIADITVAQGIDPSTAILVGGGGAAGLNSIFVSRRLGCKSLLIPETGAALSAAGAMMSQLVGEYAMSVFTSISRFDRDKLKTTVEHLGQQCRAFTQQPSAAGAEVELSYIAEARYEGQVWDIDVPLDVDVLFGAEGPARFRRDFDALHEKIFAVRDEASDVEIIGLRAAVRCTVRTQTDFRLDTPAGAATAAAAPRQIYFHGEGRVETPVLRLEAIEAGVEGQGPAIIESPFTTIVVDSAARYRRTAAGSIVIRS